MTVASKIGQVRERALAYWMARTEQERKFLAVGAAVMVVALFYLVLLAPALEGSAKLRRSLPELRRQDAQLRSLAAEATALANQPVPPVTPMTRETLTASLSARGINAASLTMTGEYAKLQLNGVSFANLMAWLDAQRRESRIAVQEAAFTALDAAGQVDAGLTLRQDTGAGAR